MERYERITDAIQRESNMKHWPRAWKARLILDSNPGSARRRRVDGRNKSGHDAKGVSSRVSSTRQQRCESLTTPRG
jgi:hypothetical protein